MQAFRREVCDVGRDNRDRNFDGRVVDPFYYPGDEHRQGQTKQDAAADEIKKQRHALGETRRVACCDCRNCELQRQQAAGVVDQAFSLDHVRDFLRQADSPGDGRGCDRVGGANDRAQNHSLLPGEVRENPAARDRHAPHRETYKPQRQHRNAHQVVAEIAPGSLRCRREKQWWKEQQEIPRADSIRCAACAAKN